MKQSKIGKCISFYFALIYTITLLGCGDFGEFEKEGLDAKTEKKVLRDIVRYLNKRDGTILNNSLNMSIVGYHGTYNGSIVVTASLNDLFDYHDSMIDHCFSGVMISYTASTQMFVWKSGDVYTIKEAWDSGILTVSNMQSIAENKSGRTDIWCTDSGCKDCN